MKRIVTFVLLVQALFTAHAQITDRVFAAEVKKSIELQNTKETFVETYKMAMQQFVDNGTLSATNLNLFANDIADYIIPLLTDRMEVLYYQNLTLDELKQLNEYLASSVGQKMIKLTPLFSNEGMKVAQLPEVQAKIQERITYYLSK